MAKKAKPTCNVMQRGIHPARLSPKGACSRCQDSINGIKCRWWCCREWWEQAVKICRICQKPIGEDVVGICWWADGTVMHAACVEADDERIERELFSPFLVADAAKRNGFQIEEFKHRAKYEQRSMLLAEQEHRRLEDSRKG